MDRINLKPFAPRKIVALLGVLLLVLSSAANPSFAAASPSPLDAGFGLRHRFSYDRIPLSFEKNEGQVDASIDYLSQGSGYALSLSATKTVLALSPINASRSASASSHHGEASARLRTRLLGANPRAEASGLDLLPGKVNYLNNRDSRRRLADIPTYSRVEYEGVYPGVNLVYHGEASRLEYDFVVTPGADPGRIRLKFEGAGKISIDSNGDLLLPVDGGILRQRRPTLYQEANGIRRTVEGSFELLGKRTAGFKIGKYDPAKTLVIDPTLSYSTYLTNNTGTGGDAIARDGAGNVYISGTALLGAYVAKLNPAGSAFVYVTYLNNSVSFAGGGGGLAVDAQGNAYVAGLTNDAGVAASPQAVRINPDATPGNDVFVAKLNPAGDRLLYEAVYDTGFGVAEVAGIALDSSGDAYVAAYSGIYFINSFAFKLNAAGTQALWQLNFKSDQYLSDQVAGITVDQNGDAYLTGVAESPDFQTTPGAINLGPHSQTQGDVFVTKVNGKDGSILYSGRFGGASGGKGKGIAVDASGRAYVVGETNSQDFPTKNPAQPTCALFSGFICADELFVARLSADGGGLDYGTYLGGTGNDDPGGIAVDAAGNAYVIGTTYSTDFPTKNPVQAGHAGPSSNPDAFVSEFDPNGQLVFSTYLGGSDSDFGNGIVADGAGGIYVTGDTLSKDFPVANAANPTLGDSGTNPFIAKIQLENAGGDGGTGGGAVTGGGPTASKNYQIDASGGAVEIAGAPYVYLFLDANPAQTNPPDTPAILTVKDPTGQTVYSSNATFSGNALIVDWLYLGVQAKPGAYSVQFQFQDAALADSFVVPASASVAPASATPQAKPADDGSLQVSWSAAASARYYMIQLFEADANGNPTVQVTAYGTSDFSWTLPAGTLKAGKSYIALLVSLDSSLETKPLAASFYGRGAFSSVFQIPTAPPGGGTGGGGGIPDDLYLDSPKVSPASLPASGGTVSLSVTGDAAGTGTASVAATVTKPDGSTASVPLALSDGTPNLGTWSGSFDAPANATAQAQTYQVVFSGKTVGGTAGSSTSVSFSVAAGTGSSSGGTGGAGSVSVVAPGTADPWLAGMPDSTFASEADLSPEDSPVLVSGLTLAPGIALTFQASGSITEDASTYAPDGGAAVKHVTGAENGIADYSGPAGALVGVFLGPDQPDGSAAPSALDFSAPDSRSAATIQPGLKQVFFIGAGTTPDGKPRATVVPTGATRLYLGVMDGNYWYDNEGSFNVQVSAGSSGGSVVTETPKPGDLNGDGKVNVQDATLSLRIAVGLVQPTDAQKTADDANHDGKLNVQDATLILRAAVGLAVLK